MAAQAAPERQFLLRARTDGPWESAMHPMKPARQRLDLVRVQSGPDVRLRKRPVRPAHDARIEEPPPVKPNINPTALALAPRRKTARCDILDILATPIVLSALLVCVLREAVAGRLDRPARHRSSLQRSDQLRPRWSAEASRQRAAIKRTRHAPRSRSPNEHAALLRRVRAVLMLSKVSNSTPPSDSRPGRPPG